MNTNEIVTEAFIAKEIITIDPGKNGGIVKHNGSIYETWPLKKMFEVETLHDFFKYQKEQCKLPLIFMERITDYTGDFKDKNGKQVGRVFQMQKLKRHYAELRSAIKLSKIQFIEVMPSIWQKYIGIHMKGEDYRERKNRYKEIAQDWYPAQKVVGWNSDAFLLQQFARKKLKYEQQWIHRELKKNPIRETKIF